MQLNINLNLYLIGCPKEILRLIKKASDSALLQGENFNVNITASNKPDKDMRGFAIILYGDKYDNSISEYIDDAEFLLLDHDYDISLIKAGVSDIISDCSNVERLYGAVINLIRRAYLRRRFELRDNMLKTYYDMSDNMLWTKDLKDLHMDINHFLIDLVGKPVEKIEGKHEIEIYNLDPNDPGCGESDNYVRTNGLSSSFFETMPDKSGAKHHFAVVKSPWFDNQGRIVGTIGIGKDVTELMNQQSRFNTFINSLDYIIVITDCDNNIIQVNRAFADVTDDAAVSAKSFNSILNEYFTPVLGGTDRDFSRYDEEKQSERYWHLSTFSLRDFWDEHTGNIYILEDVTTQKEQSRQLMKMMRTDSLTGTNNKAGMYDNFNRLDKNSKSSFFLISLDNFRYIGNFYGHETADKFLVDIAHLIVNILPECDVTRYSENEFFVQIPGNLYEGQVRKRARDLVERISAISGYPDDIIQKCPVYIGVLYDAELSEYIDTIIKKCEVAMLRAKKSNTNRYFVSYGS
ncbi:diguanylate cyclase domain-containing protein [Lachnospiraceae bacterium C1.1]|nr:diguanylate cyclase [Lachnospiraceae bacterium C1.1]